MNTLFGREKKRWSLLHLDRNEAESVHAVAGTIVACLRGGLWITQSGERKDFIVAGGSCYLSRSSGLLVVNALDGPSTALVYCLAPRTGWGFLNKFRLKSRHAKTHL